MGKCCCCHEEKSNSASMGPKGKNGDCNCAGQEIDVIGKTARADMQFEKEAILFDSGDAAFAMLENHKLTDYTRALWNLHKEIIDATLDGGWDNEVHPWQRDIQDFWRYPLAFCDYGMLSMAMIEPEMKDEIVEYARKTLLLMKDTPIWDEWIRFRYNDNPITKDNIMYKGHLQFVYGVYQLLSGSREFEEEYKDITEIIVRENLENSKAESPYWGIQCEPDQYFPQCNSIGMMGLWIYDLIFGTNYNEEISKNIYKFIFDHVSDKKTGLLFAKYHPSHGIGEPYITGFCNSWGLTMLEPYNPKVLKEAYQTFIRYFGKELMDGKAMYIKEYANFDEASTLTEESMGVFYSTALTKVFEDKEAWEKFSRYFIGTYGIEIVDGTARFTKASPVDESFVHSYILWGQIQLPWEKVLSYDWDAFQRGEMK